MPTVALNKIVAVEKSSKSRSEKELTASYHLLQKEALLQGLVREYKPLDDDGEQFPGERKNVQYRVDEIVDIVSDHLVNYFDVIATKDWGNTEAKADVVVDGTTLMENVPVTYLLFLEKQLIGMHAFISKFPTLDPGEEWHYDETQDCYRSEATQTHKSKKVPRAHVLYEATDKHPAQVEVYTEDVVVGNWTSTKFSGALPKARVTKLLERVERLQEAVKFAREEANSTEVEQRKVGQDVLDYIFASTEG